MFENEERGEGEGPSITKIKKNHLVFLIIGHTKINHWNHVPSLLAKERTISLMF